MPPKRLSRAAAPSAAQQHALSAACNAQVHGCGAALDGDAPGQRYLVRYRVCERCLRADFVLSAAGAMLRFCQARARARPPNARGARRAWFLLKMRMMTCGSLLSKSGASGAQKCSRFQPLVEFDRAKRTCAAQLAKQTARRAVRAGAGGAASPAAAAAAGSAPGDDEQPAPAAPGRRRAAGRAAASAGRRGDDDGATTPHGAAARAGGAAMGTSPPASAALGQERAGAAQVDTLTHLQTCV